MELFRAHYHAHLPIRLQHHQILELKGERLERLFIQRASPALLGAEDLLFGQIELTHNKFA
jgi:hypothetical protein